MTNADTDIPFRKFVLIHAVSACGQHLSAHFSRFARLRGDDAAFGDHGRFLRPLPSSFSSLVPSYTHPSGGNHGGKISRRKRRFGRSACCIKTSPRFRNSGVRRNPFDCAAAHVVQFEQGRAIGGVPCVMNSLLTAFSPWRSQVLSCFSLACSLSRLPSLRMRARLSSAYVAGLN
jgi:hypothetical protein